MNVFISLEEIKTSTALGMLCTECRLNLYTSRILFTSCLLDKGRVTHVGYIAIYEQKETLLCVRLLI